MTMTSKKTPCSVCWMSKNFHSTFCVPFFLRELSIKCVLLYSQKNSLKFLSHEKKKRNWLTNFFLFIPIYTKKKSRLLAVKVIKSIVSLPWNIFYFTNTITIFLSLWFLIPASICCSLYKFNLNGCNKLH